MEIINNNDNNGNNNESRKLQKHLLISLYSTRQVMLINLKMHGLQDKGTLNYFQDLTWLVISF